MVSPTGREAMGPSMIDGVPYWQTSYGPIHDRWSSPLADIIWAHPWYMVFPTGRDPIGPFMIHGLLHTGRNLMGPPYWNGTYAQDEPTLVTWPMALWAHIRWTHVHWPEATIICSMYTEWNTLKALDYTVSPQVLSEEHPWCEFILWQEVGSKWQLDYP